MKRRAVIFGILTALLLCFIWGQSMLPHDVSAGESTGLMQRVKPLLDPKNRIEDETFHHYLRKTAHFCEYAALGFCMCGFLTNLCWERRPQLRIPAVVVFCILAASIDETIQLFSYERGPHVRDVLLDACGAVFGIAVFLLLHHLIRNRKTAA